jgi:hypothetical protein
MLYPPELRARYSMVATRELMMEESMTLHDVLPYLIAQIPSIAMVILGIVFEGRAYAKIHATLDSIDRRFDKMNGAG